MNNSQITRVPLKYLPILQTLWKESVWKIFLNILWWNEILNDMEKIYFNLIMVDINNIQWQVNIGKKYWIEWKEYWKLGGRPKKTVEGDIIKTPPRVNEKTPNISKDNISKDKIIEDNINNNTIVLLEQAQEKIKYWYPEINWIIALIKKYNSWICDWTQKDQRKYWKLLVWKLKDVESVKASKFTIFEILEMILTVVEKDKFHNHKIAWPKNIYYNLSELIQIAKRWRQSKVCSLPSTNKF